MEMQETPVMYGLPGTVRVNMLANLEALLNVIANSFELTAMAFGLVLASVGLFTYHRYIYRDPIALYNAGRKAHVGAFLIKFGLLVPGIVNWLVAVARDSALFN
ncbi:MAG: hypothetical protein WC028_25865 [Candidatus Obscuribacterales bacterium]